MMWEQIRANKRKSMMLVVLMAALLFVLGYFVGESIAPGGGLIGLGVAFLVWMILSLVAYFQGDSILLAASGAREITHDDHPQLFNVVEEMKIAAALPAMPKVYIIDDMALNAFAAGRSPDRACIAVTAGLLARLNRDQLQGVVAHEMSHVLNRDVLFMSMVGVMLGAIVMVSEIYLRSLFYGAASGGRRFRGRGRASGGGQAQIVMIVVAVVLAILAPILAQLIYFAVSRRREYLADANAAVLTRYPEGLASALEVIGGSGQRLAKANKATAPMYIINPFCAGRKAAAWDSTHPPIEQRVKILRSITGGVSFQQYETALRTTAGRRGGHLPKSALKSDAFQPIREPAAEPAPAAPKQQMRQAGDLLRNMHGFMFLPCACGLQLKLPPEFKRDQITCPRCGKTLQVPVAQLAAAGAVGELFAPKQGAPDPYGVGQSRAAACPAVPVAKPRSQPQQKEPVEITRTTQGWMSFKCPCGVTHTLTPAFAGNRKTCQRCGREIHIHTPGVRVAKPRQ